MVRFRGVSIMTAVGVALLLLTLAAPAADAQRVHVLRPAPRAQFGFGAGRPRAATVSQHFFTSCFATPFGFSPFFGFPFFGGGFPFVNIQVFTESNQPSPDPTSHIAPNANGQPVPVPGSYPVPNVHPVPGLQPVPGAATTSVTAVPAFGAPVYSAPVYSAPVYSSATPVAVPRVSNGMVIGDVIDDPSFLLWGSGLFVGGGITCIPTRFLGGGLIVR